jgi:hypothetical protein
MSLAVESVRKRHVAKASLSLLALWSALAWGSTAIASPSFPATVDADLDLPPTWVEKTVAPPDGCLLCHNTEAGGLGNTNAFGTEMKRSGAAAEVTATLKGALAAIAASDPLAIADIKMGENPNKDAKWLEGATSVDPVPGYGCGSISPGDPRGSGKVALLGLIVAATMGRRMAFRRRARPGSRGLQHPQRYNG